MLLMNLLAQATQPTTQPQGPGGGGMMEMLLMFAAIGAVFYFIMLRPKQKEQKQRQDMLNNVQKYDKVMTIGGVVGTVMEVRDDEVIVKVDESTNTRMKFIRGAIQKVITDKDDKLDKASDDKK